MKLKKKAILSALAMLVVTAIALSSATFAWFTAGTQVSVQTISANISASDGSLLISANGSVYDTEVTAAEIAAETGAPVSNILPSNQATGGTFVPVSVTPDATGGQVIAGNIGIVGTTRTFNATGAATGGFFKVTIWLKADSAMSVTVTPTWSRGIEPFVYASLATNDETDPLVLGAGGDNYLPIANGTVSCLDSNANSIVDAADTGFDPGYLGTQVTAAGTGTLSISLAADTPETVSILIWAEGQDSDCAGAISAATASLSLSVTKD